MDKYLSNDLQTIVYKYINRDAFNAIYTEILPFGSDESMFFLDTPERAFTEDHIVSKKCRIHETSEFGIFCWHILTYVSLYSNINGELYYNRRDESGIILEEITDNTKKWLIPYRPKSLHNLLFAFHKKL